MAMYSVEEVMGCASFDDAQVRYPAVMLNLLEEQAAGLSLDIFRAHWAPDAEYHASLRSKIELAVAEVNAVADEDDIDFGDGDMGEVPTCMPVGQLATTETKRPQVHTVVPGEVWGKGEIRPACRSAGGAPPGSIARGREYDMMMLFGDPSAVVPGPVVRDTVQSTLPEPSTTRKRPPGGGAPETIVELRRSNISNSSLPLGFKYDSTLMKVTAVTEKGPAERAGVKEEWRIVAVNDRPVERGDQLRNALSNAGLRLLLTFETGPRPQWNRVMGGPDGMIMRLPDKQEPVVANRSSVLVDKSQRRMAKKRVQTPAAAAAAAAAAEAKRPRGPALAGQASANSVAGRGCGVIGPPASAGLTEC